MSRSARRLLKQKASSRNRRLHPGDGRSPTQAVAAVGANQPKGETASSLTPVLGYLEGDAHPVVGLSTWGLIAGLGAIASLLVLILEYVAKPLRRAWRWATRRRRLIVKLHRLVCGAHIEAFEKELGTPPQYRSDGNNGGWYLFVLDEVYVEAVTDRAGSVNRFAITTRSPSFTPVLSLYGPTVVLGRTKFAEVDASLCDGLAAGFGGHSSSYSESYYLANPGGYQTWVAASNDAGPGTSGDLPALIEALGGTGSVYLGSLRPGERKTSILEMPNCWHSRPAVVAFREATSINTVSLSGPHQPPVPDPGPNRDQVRLLYWRQVPGRSGFGVADRAGPLVGFVVLLALLVVIVLLTR
jgi:hypothetical protein